MINYVCDYCDYEKPWMAEFTVLLEVIDQKASLKNPLYSKSLHFCSDSCRANYAGRLAKFTPKLDEAENDHPSD